MKFLNTQSLLITITLLQLLNPSTSLSAMKKPGIKRKRSSEQNVSQKETKYSSTQSLFANSCAQAASLANNITDKVIQYGLVHPATMWFDGQSQREQERMVVESKPGSIAHKCFRKKHGNKKYRKLIENKPEHHNAFSNQSPLATAVLLGSLMTPNHNTTFNESHNNDSTPNDNSLSLFVKNTPDSAHARVDAYAPEIKTTSPDTSPLNVYVAHDITSKPWLDTYALDFGLGYKTANMTVLAELIKDPLLQNLPGNILVAVPEFVGIPDQQTKHFLKRNNLDIEAEWKILLQNVSTEGIKNLIIPEGFIQKLEALADRIKEKFETTATQLEAPQYSGLFSFFTSNTPSSLTQLGFDETLEALITFCAHNNAFITTRSTGREDTEELANAGGNASNEIVQAKPADVLRGMGIVVSSYFREKSFRQRALLQDKQLYDVPLMPVLVQRVVAETNDSPFSGCVSYTREPQGDIPGVSISQCTHGHTKGVVDSLVPLDTYVCDQSRCHVIVKNKPTRLAPVTQKNKKFALDFVANNDNIQNTPSLTPEQQWAIAQVLSFIEKAYGKPMDLELSFDHQANTLYLYQARPLVMKRSLELPSYIVDDSNLGTALECTTMSQAGGSLRLITDKNRIIVTSTLDDALHFYLAQREKDNNYDFDVVVVQKQADATSHAAATFNGMGKPVMVVQDYEQLIAWIKTDQCKLLTDVQNNKIYNVAHTPFAKNSIKELAAMGLIKQGLRAYPIAQMLSIPDKNQLPDDIQLYAQLQNTDHKSSLEILIETLKGGSQDQAMLALNTILSRLAQQIRIKQQQVSCPENKFFDCADYLDLDCPLVQTVDNICFTEQPAKLALEQLNSLFALALELRTDIINQLGKPSFALERLLPIAFLETLLFQKPSNEIVDNYSYISVLERYHKTISFIKSKVISPDQNKTISPALLNNQELLTLAEAGAYVTFTDTVENNWLTFLNYAAQHFSQEQQKNLTVMLNDIIELKMLPAWMNTRFAAQTKSAPETFRVFFTEYHQDHDFLTQLKYYKDLLDHTNLDEWQEDAQFEQLTKSFDEQILAWFISPELTQIIKNPEQHPFAYQAAVSTMNALVETFDQIIKSIKSSSKIDTQVRAQHFKTMLGRYLELLEQWALLVPAGVIKYHQELPLDKYLNKLRVKFASKNALDSELLPSPGFNVNAAALGSSAYYGLSELKTLEDLFTTVHQSLLVIIRSYNRLVEIKEQALPQTFNTIRSSLDVLNKEVEEIKCSASRTGTTFEKNTISYHYNIPIRFHSMALTLSFSKETNDITIALKFYGDKIYRWQVMEFYAQTICTLYDFSLQDTILNEHGASFTMNIHDSSKANALSDIVKEMIRITFHDYKTIYDDLIPKNPIAVLESLSLLKPNAMNVKTNLIIIYMMNKFNQSLQEQIILKTQELIPHYLKSEDKAVLEVVSIIMETIGSKD